MGDHYGDIREAEYAEHRRKSNAAKQPVIDNAKALLLKLKQQGFGSNAKDHIEEAIFWMEKEIY